MRFHLSILLVAAPLGATLLAGNSGAGPALKQTVNPVFAAAQSGQTTPADGVRRISVADARAEFEGGKAIIIDVRGDLAYRQGHIKGAQSIAINELESHLKDLPKDKEIILYCSCPAEHSSVAAALILKNKKVANTAALVGGYPAWKNAGYPVEESSSN